MIGPIYLPEEGRKNLPVVIGLTGFLHFTERGRCEAALERLASSPYNLSGIKINFPGINIKCNGDIECEFNLQDYIAELRETIEFIRQDKIFNSEKIGVFASSLGAGIFGHYLAQNPDSHGISSAVLVSPFTGWSHFATPYLREAKLTSDRALISSTQDYQTEIIRYIPKQCFPEVRKTDVLPVLRDSDLQIEVMTIIGKYDQVVEPKSMKKMHSALHGKRGNLLKYRASHEVPHEAYIERAASFLANSLIN